MSRETFVFTSATLRSLRLQQEHLDWERERRALARQARTMRRPLPAVRKAVGPRRPPEPQYCRDPVIYSTLLSGDVEKVKTIFQDEAMANVIMEMVQDEMVWSSELGLWALAPKTKQTSALRVVAGRGFAACVKALLAQGAEVNATTGGSTALHDACAGGHTDCVQLLLNYGANPNSFSTEGSAPLHLCSTPNTYECAKLLVEYGATVNIRARDSQVTPLHVSARSGLEEHLALYLCHGADVCARNREGETALNAACAGAERPSEGGRYYRVVQRLLGCGGDPRVAGRKQHTPLHNACANCSYRITDLLLEHGAAVNLANCAGYTPMDCLLQVVEDYLDNQPEGIVRSLLNHGAQPVHPKMLKLCAMSPLTMEVILNSYDSVPLCHSWIESVPPQVWQEHQTFYESVVQMTNQPRRLQHLARCALRHHLGDRCHSVITQLPLPEALKCYLLLSTEGCLT
ncbi:ankyrin repeat and SOCS box protein 16 [Lepisosteus oculatus]|uniref:ankyrin repeat and SOCS box protein 16 n=1 Tax=Lepisosteus oculatus TaxID=7918 RepID=UPI003719675E